MSKVGTDKKLELIRAIRMQNHSDRQLFRSRENLLYSDTPSGRHGELYSLEAYPDAMNYSYKDASAKSFGGSNVADSNGNRSAAGSVADGSILKGFRVRFVLAMVLFLAFVYCDRSGVKIAGQSTDALYQMILDTKMIPVLTGLFQ